MKQVNKIIVAAKFAARVHAGQTRKYTGDLYINHPARVAARTMLSPLCIEDMVCAAWLHDVVEDCGVQFHEIDELFGTPVCKLVARLTNPSKGMKAPRDERKRIDREHIAYASPEAKVIKLLDRIDNISEMFGAPPDFARLYAKETELLVEAIGDADANLAQELQTKTQRMVEFACGRSAAS